jgi:hypothetical protein
MNPIASSLISTLLVIAATGCTRDDKPAIPATRPTAVSLTERPVVGALGIELGTVSEIRAIVIAGNQLRTKQYQGSYLLRVTDVDGRALTKPRLMEFSIPSFTRVKLASDAFGLYELKTGIKAGPLDSKQIAEIEKGYVGKEMRLVVYETGRYSGIPANLPKDVPVWQDHAFEFSTSLVVLAERP